MKYYRVYKTEIGKARKDGSRLVKSYGCDGSTHYIITDVVWCDKHGCNAVNGKANVRLPRYNGRCKYDKTCKNLGFFGIDK